MKLQIYLNESQKEKTLAQNYAKRIIKDIESTGKTDLASILYRVRKELNKILIKQENKWSAEL